MSFLQDLKGVKVLPSPALRDGDQANGGVPFFEKNPSQWPQGYAFGGWIYDAQVSLGFSKRPTQVTLSVVLEDDSTINRIQRFDISDRLLEVSLITENGWGGAAANFGHEFWAGHFYTIDLHGIKFNRMYLFDYNIAVESGQKTLSVTLKDYSVILDKVYVGLMNRQGPGRVPSTPGNVMPVCGPGAVYAKNEKLLRKGAIAAKLTTFCPNCYLMGEDFNTDLGEQHNRGLVDPEIKTSYGGYLKGFFTKQTGWIQRNITIGSFIGRPHVNSRAVGVFQNNFIAEGNTTRYEVAKKCYGETKAAWDDSGGEPIIVNGEEKPWYFYQNTSVVVDGQSYDCGMSTNMVSLLEQHAGVPHQDFEAGKSFDSMKTIRYPIADYWGELYTRVANTAARYGQGQSQNNIGFTMDGGFLMLGSEEFSEAQCGAAPNVSYNFSELITSLRNRGFIFHGVPDKNPKFRANYMGTLREVLEQWCGVFSLDYYYQDTDNGSGSTSKQRGFHFLDLEEGARIDPIRGVVDPSHYLGREFGAEKPDEGNQIATSVILSYKESATLENTYIQSCITSNVRPFNVKQRKKTIKRYVPILPLHPCDFSIPNHEPQTQTTLLGEKYNYYKIANFIPWWPNPQSLPLEDGWDHRRRMWNRTNRELWEMDVSMALCRLDPNLRDMAIANRICSTSLSERCPLESYPAGHEKAGDPIQYHEVGHGGAGAEATQQEIDDGADTIGQRLGWNPGSSDHCHDANTEADFKANIAALGFEEVVEIEDFLVKENIVKEFLKKEDIPDVSYDVSHFKMFLGYYDEKIHEQHKDWEKKCAESMYGFGAVFGGTIPAEPFIPRDYYGIRDGNKGFEEGTCGVSIPKLKNSFEPNADQYPHYSLEALNAPFNGLLVNSGMYLPTGLHIAKLDNPWGTSVEEYEKEFWRKFSDNACKEYNNSLNIIEDAGFNNVPNKFAADGTAIGWKKNSDPFPFKKQGWEMGMFTPKFFKDAEKILDNLPGVIEGLHTEGRLVDEVSVSKRSVEYGEQRYCKKLTLMILTDTRPNKHPNISFTVDMLPYGIENAMIRRQRELWEVAEHKRKARDDVRNRCDVDLVYEFCEDAVQRDNAGATDPQGKPIPPTYSNRDGWGEVDKQACAVDPTGVYKEGFARELIGGYKNPNGVYPEINPGVPNSRVLRLQIIRNPTLKGFIPTSEDGEFHLQDLREEMEVLPRTPLNFDIVYPVNNFEMVDDDLVPWSATNATTNTIPAQFYSGIWTAEQTLEDRMPETVEIYGNPPATHNPTAGVRIVNNTVDPDLGAIMDPDAKGFITQMYDNHGEQIETIEGFHNHIAHGHQWGLNGRGPYDKGLNDFSVIKPNKKIDLRLAGSLMDFPLFREYCYPAYGLQDLSISFSDQGVQTSLSFADRPAQAPQMEGILNKIGPRTM